MAVQIADDFMAGESPDIVRFIDSERTAREVFGLLSQRAFGVAVLFNEYWASYRYTGRVPVAVRA